MSITKEKNETITFPDHITENGNSIDINVSQRNRVRFLIKVENTTGTSPVLTVTVKGKYPTLAEYRALFGKYGSARGTSLTITTDGLYEIIIERVDFTAIRLEWTVAGTDPSFDLSGEYIAIYSPYTEDVNLYTTLAGERLIGEDNSYLSVKQESNFVQGNTSQAVLSGAGWLKGLFISSASSATIVIYDNTAASGTVILASLVPAANQYIPLPDVLVTNGIYISISGTVEYTVLYGAES